MSFENRSIPVAVDGTAPSDPMAGDRAHDRLVLRALRAVH